MGATNGVAGAYAAAFYGPVIVGGSFTVVGAPRAPRCPIRTAHTVVWYCMESPESWFEDSVSKETLLAVRSPIRESRFEIVVIEFPPHDAAQWLPRPRDHEVAPR